MEYYSAIKKNEVVLFAGKWMERETIMLMRQAKLRKSNIARFRSYGRI
jgi:UDP-N-acetylmuramyl tripeptide synthase